MENEILYIKKYPNAKDSYLESTILSMKELELLFHKVLKKKKKINSTEEFETIMKKTLNNKKVNECILGASFTYPVSDEDLRGDKYESKWSKEHLTIFNYGMETYDENEIINAILKTPFKKKIIKEIEKEFKVRLAKGRLKNFEKLHSDAMNYNGYDILINYLRTCKMCAITKIGTDNHMLINCNDEPHDVDDNNTPISYSDMSAFM